MLFLRNTNSFFWNPFMLFFSFSIALMLLYRTLCSFMSSSIKTNHRGKESGEGREKLFIWQAHYSEHFSLEEKKLEELMFPRETPDASSNSLLYIDWADITQSVVYKLDVDFSQRHCHFSPVLSVSWSNIL